LAERGDSNLRYGDRGTAFQAAAFSLSANAGHDMGKATAGSTYQGRLPRSASRRCPTVPANDPARYASSFVWIDMASLLPWGLSRPDEQPYRSRRSRRAILLGPRFTHGEAGRHSGSGDQQEGDQGRSANLSGNCARNDRARNSRSDCDGHEHSEREDRIASQTRSRWNCVQLSYCRRSAMPGC
jgi:hypothetical protein